MCDVEGCTQSPYFESSEGECYYHWKIRLGLMKKSDAVPMERRTNHKILFDKYLKLVRIVTFKYLNNVHPANIDDVMQHLSEALWVLIGTIKLDASSKQVYRYLYLSLQREGVRFLSSLQEEETYDDSSLVEDGNTLDIHEIVEEEDLKEHRKYMIYQFVYQELNDLESRLFYDLFLTEEVVTLRNLGKKYTKSYEWVRKYGERLYNRFKIFVTQVGYAVSDFI